MTSRVRGPSKEGPREGFDRFRAEETKRNGTRENRYHFGMRPEDSDRNGGTYDSDDPDLLYKRSKEQFASWDIKDIVPKDFSRKSRKEAAVDDRLTNGRIKSVSPLKHRSQDRLETTSEHQRRDRGDEKEDSVLQKIPASPRDDVSHRNNRDRLLREIEELRVDGKSPDRRIRAMIERFKSREEGKLRTKRERRSLSPENEEEVGKGMHESRGELRSSSFPIGSSPLDPRAEENRCLDRVKKESREERLTKPPSLSKRQEFDQEELGRVKKDDETRGRSVRRRESGRMDREDLERVKKEENREEDRKIHKSRRQEEKLEKGEEINRRNRSTSNRRSLSAEKDFDNEKEERKQVDRNRRRSREIEEDRKAARDDSRRRSYAYERSPEDFDVRIQRYERGPPEVRKDVELSRRNSVKERDLIDRDVTKKEDREISRKSSFKGIESKKNSRDSSLNRKASFKEQDIDGCRKHSFREQENKYSHRDTCKDQESDLVRRNSFKDSFKDPSRDLDLSKKSGFKSQVEFGRISFKDQDDSLERRNSFKEQEPHGLRITFKQRNHESDGKISLREPYDELGRKNSFKEKTVEFGKISYKDPDDEYDKMSSAVENETDGKRETYEFGRSYGSRDDEVKCTSYKSVEDESANPFRDDDELKKTRDSKDRDSSKRRVSLRKVPREALESKSDRHSRPLTPPKQSDPENKSLKSWHESNKVFSANYLRENSKVRGTPEGRLEIDREFSLENQQSSHQIEAARAEDSLEKPNYSSTHERNGTTIIRIRSNPEESIGIERRRRRRPVQDVVPAGRRRRYDEGDSDEDDEEEEEEEEDEEDRRRSSRRADATPSRRIWNYREGGVLITDVEEGQPCLQCGETCPGFSPHSWRKNCTSCKCPREAHDVFHEEWVSVRSRLGLKGEESSGPVGVDPRERGLAWVPPGLPPHKVEEYFSMLPEISVPRLGTPGERHRDRQLAYQLPKQDLARAYCRHLDPKHSSSADDFMAARNEIALDIGSVQEVLERDLDCEVCHAPLKYGSLAVSASKLGILYHPACFRCAECKELLVDLAYCVQDDILYCERHYAEQIKPRCAACDELIFSGEYTKAMNKDWHSGHFCCWQCDESLTGQRYVLRDEHPYCIKCYESVFANGCEECNKIIGIDSKDLSYKDKHWHEACFLCNRCRVSLVDKQFGSKVDKIYCGNCYDAQFASRCDGCGEIFRAGTKKMEYKTRQWHEKCFCCVVCRNPIGTKTFIPREQEIYCAGCYEDKFATRCVKCNKIITSGGVTYKNEPWHRDCFTCSNCNTSLAGQRFTSRDEKPYCAECFGELFAKRCIACSKPITGIGGTRFISFEDRHWHNDCFICAGCKTSLVGRGFITDGDDIICPECAKMKLM